MENREAEKVLGDFKLSENVISTIVITAATEVEGVACMAEFSANIKNILSKDIAKKSTKIKLNESAIIVDLCVKVYMDSNLKQVVEKIQENVKAVVQNMTNLIVARVNVTVAGLYIEPLNKVDDSEYCDDGCQCDCNCNCLKETTDEKGTKNDTN